MKNIFTSGTMNGVSLMIYKKLLAFVLPLFVLQAAYGQLNYVVGSCTEPYVQVQGQMGSTYLGAGDDVIFANIALPFTFSFYNTNYTTVNIGTNGFIVFQPGTNRGLGNATLPTATAGAAMYPFWDDLDADQAIVPQSGVHTRVDGVAPNRIFTVEWYRIGHFNMAATTGDITFQVRLFETSNRILYKYSDVIFAGAHVTFNNGMSATVGLEGVVATPRPNTLVGFNIASVQNGNCLEFILPVGCNPVPSGPLTVGTSPGSCGASPTIPLPAFNPAGCADGQTNGLRYRVNGGMPIIVPLPAANVTIQGLNPGLNTILWEVYLIGPNAVIGTATQTIFVQDLEPPTLICPADIEVNLDPGACCAVVNWPAPEVSDNCPFVGPLTELFTTTAGAPGNFFNSFAGVTFDVVNNSSQQMTIEGFLVPVTGAGPVNFNVYYTTIATTNVGVQTNAAAWTLMGSATGIPVPVQATPWSPATFTQVNIGGLVLQPGQSKGIYVHLSNYPAGSYRYTNGSFTATDGSLTILSNGFGGQAAPFSNTFASRAFVGEVQYSLGSDQADATQIGGPALGSELCKDESPFTITYQVADAQGNTATCSFTISILEYPNPTTTLACNDNVQVSVNDQCEAFVTTDMILEGGPYQCYDDYIVAVEGYGSGYGGVTIDNNAVGETLQVTVTDPSTGNSCWGTISVEDKIPPTIECHNATISCGQPLPDIPGPLVPGTEIIYSGLADPLDNPAGQNIIQEYQFDYSFLPPGTPVLDVDVRTVLTHALTMNVHMFLTAPNGFEIPIFEVGGCFGAFPIKTWWDDEGVATGSCLDFQMPRLQPFNLPGIAGQYLQAFDGLDASGIWTLRIEDFGPNTNAGEITEVGMYITVEGYGPNTTPQVDPADNCGEVTLTYEDEEEGDPCEGLIVTRHWTVTDESGNTATCDQEITVTPLNLGAVACPPAYIGHCGDSSDPEETGWPTVNGEEITDEDNICNIFVGYWDKPLNDCGNGEKIVRTWTVLDWCTQTTVECIQVIKLTDDEAPELTCPDDLVVGTDFWYCYANVSVPKPDVYDECGSAYTLTLTSHAGIVVNFGNNYVINQLPLGEHTVTWHVADECGNHSSCSFTIEVVDDVVPVANCDFHTIVALTNDGPHGITLVPASVFDDGSYDNCGPVTFRARRTENDEACIDFDWTTEGACIDDVPGGIPPVNSRDKGTVLRPCVPFACCDVSPINAPVPIMVELEVTDVAGNKNYCMVQVFVQDKLSPFVECPPDIIVSCDFWFNVQEGNFEDAEDEGGNGNGNLDEDPLSAVFGNMYDAFTYYDDESVRQDIIINDPGNETINWGIEGWADDNCEVTLSVRVTVNDDCSGGDLPANAPDGAVKLITRRFSAADGNAPGTCTQRIWVVDYDPFYINDKTCNDVDKKDGVKWPCDVLLTTCPEDLGDTGEPTIYDDACSLIGVTYEDTRFDFVDGACFKILREWAVIDWCQYNSQTGEGLWYYTQVIKVHDEDGPEFVEPCEPVTLCVADPGVSLPDNNQAFLGEDNPLSTSCSVHLNLERVVHETCSDVVHYDVKIYPFNGPDYILVTKTATAAEVDENNNATLSFNTRSAFLPKALRENGLPYNSIWCGPDPLNLKDYHRILWSVEDGCGNWSHCEYLFRLEDCKQPSPVCINGLSTVVMPVGGQVTVWAKDFNASSFDDCTPADELLYSFSGDIYQPSFTYTCENVPAFGVELSTQIWVADNGTDDSCNDKIEWGERNKDYCTTTIVITDNAGVCDTSGSGSILAGDILTEDVQSVELVGVSINAPGHVFPTYVTTQNGQYNFNNVIIPSQFSINADRNDAHRNGVSTLDLVKIQKHLLGIETMNSPYDLIAADANNSQNVSAIDLVELRKLILGIYTELPANKSWRFVDKSFQFADVTSPWPFSESINMTGMNGNETDKDFVAIKVGDVNNTVQANALQILPRNGNGVVSFVADDRTVSAGEMVDVVIRSTDFASIEGYQFTMKAEGLEFRGVTAGLVSMSDENMGVFGSTLTASWHKVGGVSATASDVLFTLSFQATSAGQLSEMININSKVTDAEAYNTSSDIKDLKLTFRGSEAGAEFALYQNEPNPFKGSTLIGYDIPVAGNVVLTVFDVTGKVLVVKEQESVKGYNTIAVSSKELPSVGIMYYRLDANEYTATKKMIIIE